MSPPARDPEGPRASEVGNAKNTPSTRTTCRAHAHPPTADSKEAQGSLAGERAKPEPGLQTETRRVLAEPQKREWIKRGRDGAPAGVAYARTAAHTPRGRAPGSAASPLLPTSRFARGQADRMGFPARRQQAGRGAAKEGEEA